MKFSNAISDAQNLASISAVTSTDASSSQESAALPEVIRYATTLLPTAHGELTCVVYRARGMVVGADPTSSQQELGWVEHVAMIAGTLDELSQNNDDTPVLCRVHSECFTSEVLGSLKCDCKAQLDHALERIVEEGRGVVLFMRQEGRGIGLGNKIRAYALQEQGHDTVDANRVLGLPDDSREYSVAVAMLHDLGVRSVQLMTNNPLKVSGLENAGMNVQKRLPHVTPMPELAAEYVAVKRDRMGHLIANHKLSASKNDPNAPVDNVKRQAG
ncbi:MAG: GTP cyclohydrolase II [Deltaproteobacteria bacterium]|nr:GTP cyclohydrolase II [Deltaproteobacteria bacterium]